MMFKKTHRLAQLAAALLLTSSVGMAAAAQPLKAAFVYVTPVLDAGWTRQHEDGRKAMQAALGAQVQTKAVDNVAEGADAERVLRDLPASGNQLIFTTSFGYM